MEFALPATGFLTIVLAKMRCLWKGPCATCAYNDLRIILTGADEKEWSPTDSEKTLPPPPIPIHRVLDLRQK